MKAAIVATALVGTFAACTEGASIVARQGSPQLLDNTGAAATTTSMPAVTQQPPQQADPASSPSLLSSGTATQPSANAALATAGAGQYGITFRNSCAKSVQIKYKSKGAALPTMFATLAPGATANWDSSAPNMPKEALVFTPYYAPEDTCTVDCAAWGKILTRPRQGSQWVGPNAQYAAVCNPVLSDSNADSAKIACCSKSNPNYNPATNDCPGINDMTWGTLVEFSLATPSFNVDSWDISTNFLQTDSGPVFFNIPVAVSANSAQCNNSKTSSVQFPWVCADAACTTAYQSPQDSQNNGAQIQCPAQTSYVVDFCGH